VSTGSRTRSRLELGLWIAGLLGAFVATLKGSAGSDWPPIAEPSHLGEWAADRHPLDTAAGLSRVVMMALLCYLLALTFLHLAATAGALAARPPRGSTSRVIGALVAAAVSTSSAAGIAGASGPPPGDPVPGLGATMEAVVTVPGQTDMPWATIAPPAIGGPAAARGVHPDDLAPPPPSTPRLPGSSEYPTEWLVQPGDHLWNIAERIVGHVMGHDALGRVPSDADVARYWLQLVSANRDRLVDADHPDLILPGQRLVVPRVTTRTD
jgi:hypothetical protein